MLRHIPPHVALLFVLLTIPTWLVGCHSGSDTHGVALNSVDAAGVRLRGDLDNDGTPSVADAIGILRIVVGLDGGDPTADADADGSTSVNDAIAVLRCLVGLAEWPLGEFRLPATRTIGPGVVVETDFLVGAEERVECLADTTIQCGTATITGELYGVDGDDPGEDGASVTIEALGDVQIDGEVTGGRGAANIDDEHGDTQPDGGDGGTVRIGSAEGDITLDPNALLGGGDAGDGGGSLNGGAGGTGGSVLLECPNGTLTIDQHDGLFHIGNGGDGGDGNVHGEDLLTFDLAEDSVNCGGDSGSFGLDFGELVGAQLQDIEVDGVGSVPALVVEADTFDGGEGGDAGDFNYGVDPTTEESTWPSGVTTAGVISTADAGIVAKTGAKGGDGMFRSGAGANVCARSSRTDTEGNGGAAQAVGGNAGEVRTPEYFVAYLVTRVYNGPPRVGGNGGNAKAYGGRGADSATPSGPGGSGGYAIAHGGEGGSIISDSSSPKTPGDGGSATAKAGAGGRGGNGCSVVPPVQGGTGGSGGSAEARGGLGGIFLGTPPQVGYVGNAYAQGGDNGDSGNGMPPGASAGATGGRATATRPAVGQQPPGAPVAIPGGPGAAGGECPTVPRVYKAKVRAVKSSPARYVVQQKTVHQTGTDTGSVTPTQTMPGPNWNWGPSAAMARDGSRLYAGTPEGLAVYTDPINTIGDEPDFYLSPGGPGSGSQDCTACALDETNDRVYAIYQTFSPNKTWVWGWTNASAITADRQADFGCQVPNVLANSIAVGGNDIVFLADAFDIFVFDGVHLDAGTEHAPDRRMTYVGHGEFQPMAYDEWRDLLYMFHAQEHWEHTIKVIENASTADGQDPACHEFGGSGSLIGGSNDRVVDITVFPDDDLLFVTNHGKSYILVFADASTLTGQVAPTNSVYVSDEIENAAIWRESE